MTVATDLRRISQGLRPPGLDELGLAAAIGRIGRQLGDRMTAKVTFASPAEFPRLDPSIELGVFRIAQEALHNIEKHAAARNVSMSLSIDRRKLELAVADDGIGFDLNNREPGRLGLLGMRERAELIGGTLTLLSRIGQGTKVRLVVPLGS